MKSIFVIKLNMREEEVWRYPGEVIFEDSNEILIEAYLNRDDLMSHGIFLNRGDLFLEKYFIQKYYNIYEIYDHATGKLKNWYCNICKPASVKNGSISYIDLALDLMVFPDGRQLVLDEDEFEEADLDNETRLYALEALEELKKIFRESCVDLLSEKNSRGKE
ncbi:MAG: DUF402 domain-containing protein [Anaerolineaceae bacterium]|nr:DUF402 domain-containing protein [Anaerolineaceae bacterium]